MNLTPMENFIVAMCRYNKANPPLEITKTAKIGRWKFTFNWRSKKNLWGRFGGGWNWNLGVKASGSTIILNLLVCSLCIYREKRAAIDAGKGGA